MDGLELRQTLMQTLVNGLQKSAEDRNEANSGVRFAELTGRIETMRTLLEFLVNAEVGPCANCQAVKDGSKEERKEPGPPVDSGSEEKPKRKRSK